MGEKRWFNLVYTGNEWIVFGPFDDFEKAKASYDNHGGTVVYECDILE